MGCRVGARGGRHQGTWWTPRIDTRRGGPRVTWCFWRRVGAPPFSQAPPLFKHFAMQGSSERAQGGWHQPTPWQPRSDPRRALLALTFGSSCCFRGSATFQSLLRTNFFRKQFSRSYCWSRRAPSSIFRVADRTMEANAMRLCRRLCPAARFSCPLRLLTLENYELEHDELFRKTALSQLPFLTHGSQQHT